MSRSRIYDAICPVVLYKACDSGGKPAFTTLHNKHRYLQQYVRTPKLPLLIASKNYFVLYIRNYVTRRG